jgi:hypothetical protein
MKNNWVYGIALALVVGSTYSLAERKDDDWVPPGQRGNGGGSSEQMQGQAQGQAQGQNQGQAQGQGQEANAAAGAIGTGVGIGVGGSSDQSQSSSNRNRNTNLVGASSGSRSSSGSSSASSVGDTTSISEGSHSASGAISGGNEVGQDVTVDASDQSIYSVEYDHDYPVSTAASLFTQVCQQGVSGQADDWGASAVFSDPLCDEIKVAQFYWIAHINEHEHGNDKQAAEFKEMYVAQMSDIQKMMDATDELGIIDRIAGFLIKPLGVIGLLVFLL